MRGDDHKKGIALGRFPWMLSLLLGVAPALAHAEQLPIRNYTTADGLASAYVLRIRRDSQGFLWFCTRDGLNRFDGQRFVTYGMEHGLPQSTINDLHETRNGDYWLATNGGGVCRFHPDAESSRLFTVYCMGDDPAANRVNALYEDRAGQLWAGTDNGLFRMEEKTDDRSFRRVEPPLPPLPTPFGVGAIVEDREGSLWLGTHWGLVRRLPTGRMIRYPAYPSANTLLVDHAGKLWVGHRDGLYLLTPEPTSKVGDADGGSALQATSMRLPAAAGGPRQHMYASRSAPNWVTALHQTADGRIWIATRSGLIEFDGEHFHRYTTAHGLSENELWRLAEDRDGNLWIGTPSSGAMKLTLKGFTTYDEADGLGDLRIHSLYTGPSGEVFAVSGNWFLNRFDGRHFTFAQPRLPNDADYTSTSQVAFLDRAGRWWLLTRKGLYRFGVVTGIEQMARQRPQAIYTRRDGLTGDGISRLFEDSRGDLWIATIGQEGLTRWERATETFHSWLAAAGLPSVRISAFCEDRTGNLWIGLYDGGLARYAAGRFTLFTGADGLPAGMVSALYLDQAGRLWVATIQGGLSRIDDLAAERPHFVTWMTADGLTSNNIRCLTEDRWGRLYLGTARGIDRFDPETGAVRHYTASDGLASDFVMEAMRDRRDWLWFGTLKGLSRLIPEPDQPPSPPPVRIGGLRIGDDRQAISELGVTEVGGLVLGSNQNQIQIDFFGLGFRMGEVLRYQFKLEGENSDWTAPTDQRTVYYPRLQPGTYRFLVRAVGADGMVSQSPASISFTIRLPVWRRWWFLTLTAVLFGLAIYGLHRYRVTRLLELERVRMRIATDLHDDIGSSLSQISVLSEVIRRRVGKEPAVSEPLKMIGSLSRELVDSLNDIVWAINPRRDRLSDLTQRMRRFASDAFTARDIEFRFNARDPHDMRLGADMRREVFLIFKEAVTNIVRHSKCTEADIDFVIENGRMELSVTDNGKGFDAEKASEGNGLVNMRQRTAKIGGTLGIVSGNGGGTTVWVKIPVGRR